MKFIIKFRIWILILPAILQLFPSCKSENHKPNIILITIDDLGWADLGCYGSEYYETPQIDRMASEGMLFTNSYAAAAICSPTRASIQTGKYPARLGITDWIRAQFQGGGEKNREGYDPNEGRQLETPYNPYHLNLEEITIAELLKEAGYATCHIGKWHLGTEKWYPDQQGYDLNIAGCDYGQPPSYFDPYIAYPNNWRKDTVKGFPTMEPRQKNEYLTDREADEAVKFITENQDQPFFLNLSHYAVHTPIQAKPDIVHKYQNKPTTHQDNPEYAAMVESVDQALGEIIKTLRELGIGNNTLIIFTSDNGGLKRDFATNNLPLRSGKGYPYEGGIRIPTVIWWPSRVQPGTEQNIPIISTDYLPTICEAAGIDHLRTGPVDGVSLMPLITNKGKIAREKLFWHFPHYRHSDIVPYSIIRKGDWKLIKRYEGNMFELFNLKNDISEKEDLAEKKPDMVKELNRDLEMWLEEVEARMPREKEGILD